MKRRKDMLEDLDQDIREHIERETQDNIERGMSPDDARYAAIRKFGNVTRVKEETREVWSFVWPEQLWQDVRYGLRTLRKSPGFTAVAVLTLALGIGANTAFFTLINSVMLRTLPFHDPTHLVVLRWSARHSPRSRGSYFWSGCPSSLTESSSAGNEACSFSYREYERVGSEQVFSSLSGFTGSVMLHSQVDGHALIVRGELVSGNFFSTLETRPALGRAFDSGDEMPGAEPVVLLSYGYWMSRFGGNPGVLGTSVTVERNPFAVVGVLPATFAGLDPGVRNDIWLPLSSEPRVLSGWFNRSDPTNLWVQMVGRVSPDRKIPEIESELTTLFARDVTSEPNAIFASQDAPTIEVLPVAHGLTTVRRLFSTPFLLLMASAGIILLIACANIAGLLLSRAAARRKEMAVRLALGAGRWRIVRQCLTESTVLSFAGALAGILFAYWFARSIAEFLSVNWSNEFQIDVHPDPNVLAFTTVIAVLIGILLGLAPALRSMRVDLAPALKESGVLSLSGAPGRQRFAIGNVLVVIQVALSMVALSGAALLVRTLVSLERTDPGFNPRNVLLLDVDATLTGLRDSDLQNLYREIQNRLAELPGVTSVSRSLMALLSGSNMTTRFRVPDVPERSAIPGDELSVGTDFFQTMQMRVLAGRTFSATDFSSDAKPEPVVVNEMLARRLFSGQNPLGQRFGETDSKIPDWQVVGVVGNAKFSSLKRPIQPTVYTPLRRGGDAFEIRTAGDPRMVIPAIRSALEHMNHGTVIPEFQTQMESIDHTLFEERLLARLSSLFALLALALSCIGLYGLLTYAVTRQTHEIGVRMALGAEPGNVLRLIVGRGLLLTLAGTVIGIATGYGVTRYLQSFLYGVRSTDPATFSCVALLLMLAALLASYIPARRATRVDPTVALRYE